jgi:hypothetical protein
VHKTIRAIGLVVLAAFGLPTTALAWGHEGHAVVAGIAQAYLTPAVRAKVDALLAADTDTLTAPDMLSRASWADAWRSSHRETAQWHFVDIELDHPDLTSACSGFPAPAKPASDGPAEDCVVGRISAFAAELADPATPQAEKILALKFVLHLVGDLHQPLHASDNHDHGGNCVRLALGGPRTTNLHSYWDTTIVEALGEDPVALAAALRTQITPADKKLWERGDPKTWALESFDVARTTVYAITSPPGCASNAAPITLPAGYDAAAQRAAALQLERAGVRLALILNSALQR